MTSKLTKERIEWLNYAATGLAANGTEMAMSPQDVIALTECCLAALESEPVLNVQFKNGWPVDGTAGIISGSPSLPDGYHDFYAVAQPEISDDAMENFRTAMEGIGHIRRTLEETFGGMHGTHVEPDVLAECKAICDAICLAYRKTAPQPAPELTATVGRLNASGYEYEGGEVTPQNVSAVVDILLQQLDDAVQGRNTQPTPVVPDEMLCDFYEVNNWPDLVRELVKHVEQLQDSAKRNVKPWEDTFPATLLPAFIERVKQADDACRSGQQPVVPDDGRADFEAWVLGVHGGDISKACFPDGEDYANAHTRCVWKAWSACRAAMLTGSGVAVLVNDGNIGKPLTIILPDISSKAFWSGAGRTETFHPGTYRRWVREAIERYYAIARIDVEVK